jgi:hypothetical protein
MLTQAEESWVSPSLTSNEQTWERGGYWPSYAPSHLQNLLKFIQTDAFVFLHFLLYFLFADKRTLI